LPPPRGLNPSPPRRHPTVGPLALVPPSPAPDAEPPVPGADALATADDVRRAQRGDVAAFERLYRTHVGRVTALCVRLTGERQRAEELMQDTFVRAWEKLGSVRRESPFATWLR